MAEGFLGFHPSDNLVFRLGGRVWYLQGTADATYTRATIGDPTDSKPPTAGDPAATPPVAGSQNAPNFDTAPTFANQGKIVPANPWSLFRYGILAEMTYSF